MFIWTQPWGMYLQFLIGCDLECPTHPTVSLSTSKPKRWLSAHFTVRIELSGIYVFRGGLKSCSIRFLSDILLYSVS